MSKYGDVAIEATRIAQTGVCPIEAWKTAATREFKDRIASINKGCPKSTFLGLAEDGFVLGVPSGSYTKSVLNKQYALEALALLNHDRNVRNDLKNYGLNRVVPSRKRITIKWTLLFRCG